MARKKTLEGKRAQVRKIRGRVENTVRGEVALTDVDRMIKQKVVCYLRAQDFSYGYIAKSVGVSEATIKNWLSDEDLGLMAEVVNIQDKMVEGAINHLRGHAIELMEIVIDIARNSEEDVVALRAAIEGLGMIGIAKVNKSESVSSARIDEERSVRVALDDPHGLIDALKDAPPEVQARAAEKIEELLSLTAEHTEMDVTQGAPDAQPG